MTTLDIQMGNVVVQDGWVLTCTVTDPSQFPISNGKIVARTLPSRDRMFTPLNTTAASGVATIVLPAGLYEITAEPPPTLMTTYATQSQYDLNVAADATLPNFALPPGHQLTAHCVGGAPSVPVPGANLNVDQFISPNFQRIETSGDITDVNGDVTVTVPSGTERITISPPVATKLIPFRIDSQVIGSTNVNLGTVAFASGHWVDVTVLADGTGVPIAGANINLFNLETGNRLITIDNTTLASGSTRIVTDNASYRVKIYPPSTAYDTAYVIGSFRTLQDTAVTVTMPRKGVLGVGASLAGGLRLANPWPSPARGTVHFSFSGTGEGELSIVDVLGRRVATPWRGVMGQDGTAAWSTRDEAAFPSGVYFAILRSGIERSVRRVVIAN